LRARGGERQKEKSKEQKASCPDTQFDFCKGKSGQTRQPMAWRRRRHLRHGMISHWSFQMDAVHGVIYPDKTSFSWRLAFSMMSFRRNLFAIQDGRAKYKKDCDDSGKKEAVIP
jgi:hypothetical protein